jgi:hypothetical protein
MLLLRFNHAVLHLCHAMQCNAMPVPKNPVLCSKFFSFNTATSKQRPALQTPQEMQCADQEMQKNARSLANVDKMTR